MQSVLTENPAVNLLLFLSSVRREKWVKAIQVLTSLTTVEKLRPEFLKSPREPTGQH